MIVNAGAGGFENLKDKIAKLEDIFEEIYTGPGKFGRDFLKSAKVVDVFSENFKDAVQELTVKLSKMCDVIVSVGGDGTANMIAEAIVNNNLDTPIMGVAGGTANVGPLIRFSLNDLKPPFCVEQVSCLKVWKGKMHVGYAFIDAVFGDTFLGTLSGKMVNLSAETFLKEGKKVEKVPREDIVDHLEIFRKGERIRISMEKIAQVVASPLNFSEFYIGKAITGALCLAPFAKSVGAVAFLNKVIVNSYLTEKDMKKPVILEHVIFSEDETVELKGFKKGVYLILDGNPICECDEPVFLQGLSKCVKVFSRGVKVHEHI